MKAKAKVPERPVAAQALPKILRSRAVSKLPELPLPDPPVVPQDLPGSLPGITQKEIVECATAWTIYRLARTHFEAKRAALTLKLLQLCEPERSSYELSYDARLEGNNLIIEDHTSLDLQGRHVVDRDIIPAWGAA